MKKIMFLLIILLTSLIINAQMVAVSGKVTGFHKYPFKNITVHAKKSKSKALTDENGVFTVVCYPDDILIFESKSCITAKRKIKNPSDSVIINLVFKTDEKSKEYAIGYGIIKESDLSFAMSNLSNSEIDFSIYSNIYDLIKGRFPGVEVTNRNEIIIRGVKSFYGSSSAYLIVDGVPVHDLSMVVPKMVKSIDILRDASSSAIYGVNGANGVVLITTLNGN
jgi:TonB-dependent SusC/RagA subfamily outer membrane receptor